MLADGVSDDGCPLPNNALCPASPQDFGSIKCTRENVAQLFHSAITVPDSTRNVAASSISCL